MTISPVISVKYGPKRPDSLNEHVLNQTLKMNKS